MARKYVQKVCLITGGFFNITYVVHLLQAQKYRPPGGVNKKTHECQTTPLPIICGERNINPQD